MINKIFNLKTAPYLIIIALMIYIFMIDKGGETIVVEVPAKEGVIENREKPKPTEERKEIIDDKTGKKKVVIVENPVNALLMLRYEKALKENDSLRQTQIFKEAITENSYKETFEDDVQTITVESEVVGTLTRQFVSYKTKPFTIEKEAKKQRPALYLNGFASVPTAPESAFGYGAQILLINKKKAFGVGFDNNKNISLVAGFKFL